DGENVVVRESTGEVGRVLKEQAHSVPVGTQSLIGYVAQRGEYYIAHDVSADPYHQPNPLLPDTQTQLGLPLQIGDRVIGVLDVQHIHPHTFSEDDISVLEVLADQLAVAVQNTRNFEEALERANREQAVMDITSKIRASGDVETMLRTVVQEMRLALGARSARIQLAEVPLDLQSSGDGADGSQDDGRESVDSDGWQPTTIDEGEE
ncbi:MAG: GAF domain-containing protein, partial [Anaerolineales bacterium]|nr:GAF domain-containing protein [Anaerolineales bacterium]